jgi:hypothetical protein
MKTTSLWKKQTFLLFDKIILNKNHVWHITPKVVELTICYKQQLRNNTIMSRALFRNAQ